MMKNVLLVISLIVTVVSVTALAIFFKPENEKGTTNSEITLNSSNINTKEEKNKEVIPKTVSDNSGTLSNQDKTGNNNSLQQKSYVEKVGSISGIDAEKLINETSNNNGSVKYVSVLNSGLPPFEIEKLKIEYDNLVKYGSYSGGKITHEFTKTEGFKRTLEKSKGEKGVLENLSFTPIDIQSILGKEFNLVGADYSGALNEGKFNAIFRSYEGLNGKKFEISEIYLSPENKFTLNVYKESINYNLLGHPATIQNVKGSDGSQIYTIDFNTNSRVFSFSSQGMGNSEFLQIATQIVQAADVISTTDKKI